MNQKINKFLCKIGIHNWKKPTKTSNGFTSNIYDVKKTCKNCGKTKKWIETKR